MREITFVRQITLNVVRRGELTLEMIHADIMKRGQTTGQFIYDVFCASNFFSNTNAIRDLLDGRTEKTWMPVDNFQDIVGEYDLPEKLEFLSSICDIEQCGFARPVREGVFQSSDDVMLFDPETDPYKANPLGLSVHSIVMEPVLLCRLSIDVQAFLEEIPYGTEFRDPPMRMALRMPRYGRVRKETPT